jgi:hypothetical protein
MESFKKIQRLKLKFQFFEAFLRFLFLSLKLKILEILSPTRRKHTKTSFPKGEFMPWKTRG